MKFMRPELPGIEAVAPYLAEMYAAEQFTNNGPLVQRLERRLSSRLGGRDVLVTNNCTTALMLALRLLKTPRRKYAIMPSFTFAATAQAAVWAGYEPYFVDIDSDTHMSEALVDDTLRLVGHQAVVVPCATYGEPFRLDYYDDLIEAGVPVVVDAAGSIGATWLDEPWGVGFQGTICYSMHATKGFAIGEGGAISLPEEDCPKRRAALQALRSFGINTARTAVRDGLNGKMSEMQAAYGLAVDDVFDTMLSHRQRLYLEYGEHFGGFSLIAPTFYPLVTDSAEERTALQAKLSVAGVETAVYFDPPCHEQLAFEDCARTTMQQTEVLAERVLCLPLHKQMGARNCSYVAELVRS